MTPEELAAIKFRWEDTMEPDHGCAIERVKREPFECGVCARKRRESAADVPALVAEVERLRRVEAAAKAYSDADAAIFDARKRDPSADLYLLFSDMAVARENLFAALRAAGSGE